MATPNSNWGEITTTTLHHRSKKLAESITDNTALFYLLKEGGAYRPAPGGESIIEEFIHEENGTFMYYSGGEPLNISPSESLSAFAFSWKQAAIAVTATGLEIDVQNTGPDQVIDLLSSRVDVAMMTFVNRITNGMYSDGTGTGGKQIGGLAHLVPNDPTTGTVGGVNRATYTFARSQRYRALTDGGAVASAANISDYMLALWQLCVLNKEHPTGILMDNNYWGFYHQFLSSHQRITKDEKTANAGWRNLDYMGVPAIMDGGNGGNCPANTAYFLNTKMGHISYRPHKGRNIVPLKPDRYSTNQDALVRLVAWAGNMTVRTPRLQGVLINT